MTPTAGYALAMACSEMFDRVGPAAEFGGVGPVVRGIARVDGRQPVGDRSGNRLGDVQVVEDVLIGRLAAMLPKRIRINRSDRPMPGQHLVDPWVVTAAVVDHQRRVHHGGRVGGAGLIRVRIGIGAGQDGLDGDVVSGDRARHAAPHVGGRHHHGPA
jgi:hypothetical protein